MIAMTARIKLLGRMDVIEKRRPQDGRIKTLTAGGQEVELRLSTLPTAFGEKLVMRIFDPEVVVKTLPELGFPAEDAARWDALTQRPHGIILVTGPTGSGKTTTLYTTLKALATSEVNVCTVEDPIEMVEASFNQMQVQHGIDLSFADGVRSLMRQDPDIIMVGEIRDLETAEMAIQAALTGHLVLSTLHTNDAPAAVSRLLDLGVPPYLLQSTLLGVMAQRLVRTLCPHCKIKHDYDDAAWDALVAPWKAANPRGATYINQGCLECRMTGYMGRVGIYEMMIMSPPLRDLLVAATDLDALREATIKDGMKPLRISGAMKIAAGLTTIDEIMKVAPPPAGDRRKPGRPPAPQPPYAVRHERTGRVLRNTSPRLRPHRPRDRIPARARRGATRPRRRGAARRTQRIPFPAPVHALGRGQPETLPAVPHRRGREAPPCRHARHAGPRRRRRPVGQRAAA